MHINKLPVIYIEHDSLANNALALLLPSKLLQPALA